MSQPVKKKMGTGTKVFIGIGIGCGALFLIIAALGFIAALVLPVLLPAQIEKNTTIEYELGCKKAISAYNYALTMRMANSTDFKADASCKNCNDADLAKIFEDYLNIVKKGPGANEFYTADGMKYTFTKKGSMSCGETNTNDINSSNVCYVLVDTNGEKAPNKLSDANTINDQFYLIIKQRNIQLANNMPDLNK